MATDPLAAVVEQTVVTAARELEISIDKELKTLDDLDESSLEAIRQERISHLKRFSQKKQAWLKAGHGEYSEVFSETEFFEQVKGRERAVCHFYRENLPCQVMHQRLEHLSRAHLETKFLRIQAEKAPFLVERLKIWMLPTLAIIKSGKASDYVVGFDGISASYDLPLEALESRLCQANAIYEDGCQVGPVYREQDPPVENSDDSSDFD